MLTGRQFSLIYYLVVILLLGIPIWYKTTSPTRYSLPDVANLMVHSQRIINRVSINVIDTDENTKLNFNNYNDDLINNWSRFDNPYDNIIYELNWDVRKLFYDMKNVFNFETQNIYEVDELTKLFKKSFKKGSLTIFIVNDNDWDQFCLEKKNFDYVLGSYRSFYIKRSYATCENLANLVQKILVNQLDIDLSKYPNPELISAKLPKNVESSLMNLNLYIYLNLITENTKDSIKFQNSENFDLLINLTRNKFLDELIDFRIENNINVISQMINHAFTNDFVEKNFINSNENTRLIDLKNAPQFLNSIESRISPPSNKFTLMFNILIPSSEKSHLYFYDKTLNQKSNSIVTAYQPTVMIWNEKHDFNLGFKSFIRKQLGLPYIQHKESLKRNIFLSKWELDNLIRKITNKQLEKTLESLESINNLLKKISNMVIEEEISKKLFNAVEFAHLAIDELEKSSLSKAYNLSSKAFLNSENAFFDPSLLSLLYFPEDQKYAIYFPLFFPIAIQLCSYFLSKFKENFWKKKSK